MKKAIIGLGVAFGLTLILVVGFASDPVVVPEGYKVLAEQIRSAMTDNLKSETIRKGADLQYMARTYYGDSLGWPLVWFFNTDTVANPEVVEAGTKLKIPRLKAGIDPREATKALENAYMLVYYLYANDGKHSKGQRQWVLGQARSAGLDLKSGAWASLLSAEDLAWVNGQKANTAAKKVVVPTAVVLDVKQTKAVIALAAKADEKALEELIFKAQTNNALDDLQGDLEAEAAKPESDNRPEIHFALALTYGRKGLKTQEYAALVKAEEAAKKPGVNFNFTIIYGRKQLLENDVDADKFLVGDLTIESDPSGADVSLDGKSMGKTPLSLTALKFGGHSVKLELSDFDTFEAPVEVELAKVKKVNKSLISKYAYISFRAPSNHSTLTIDGEEVEYSEPIRLTKGTHQISFVDPNFETVTQTVSFEANEKKDFTPALKPKIFTWSFVANVKEAKVSLDGVALTKDEVLKKQIPAGKHKVKYEAANYETTEFEKEFYVSKFDDLTNLYVYRDLEMVPWIVPTISGIKIDGKDDDWATVTPINAINYKLGNPTMTKFEIAKDEKYVYMLMQFREVFPNSFFSSDPKAKYNIKIIASSRDGREVDDGYRSGVNAFRRFITVEKAKITISDGGADLWTGTFSANTQANGLTLEMKLPIEFVTMDPSQTYQVYFNSNQFFVPKLRWQE